MYYPDSYCLDPRALEREEDFRLQKLERQTEELDKELHRLEELTEEEVLAEFGTEEAYCERIEALEEQQRELSFELDWYLEN